MSIRERIKNEIIYFDGALGSVLQGAGLAPGEKPETWNISRPEDITALHYDYFAAGSHIANANTFGANRLKFGDYTEKIIAAAMECAREARYRADRDFYGTERYIALDMGPTGKFLQPWGDLKFEEAVDIFAEMVRWGVKYGADLINIETMGDLYEIKAAVLAAKENSDLPIFVTAAFDQNGRLLTGGDPVSMIALLEGLGVDGLGMNCGLGPEQMKDLMPIFAEYSSTPVIVNPNAGLPKFDGENTYYDVTPEDFAADMAEIAAMGASIIGGCCGTTAEHIKALCEKTRDAKCPEIGDKGRTLVSSGSRSVEVGRAPVIIGERINPTGKARFKQALREGDMEYILDEALKQEEAGAHILDVNVGLPEIDEKAMMGEAVTKIQEVTKLPLQIDTTDAAAMELAMRLYNGKPLINSVNGKEESMNTVFPLVRKYGGAVIALTLDEKGIPDTAEGRLKIAERIYKRAAEYGIRKKDIIIDALAMAVSSGTESARVALDTVEAVKEHLGGRTVLGVSNISFGLPERALINSAFYTMALERGVSAAIINPCSREMMGAYRAFMALNNMDPQCREYIAFAAEEKDESPSVQGEGASPLEQLENAVLKGLAPQAAAAARRLLQTMKSMDIIDGTLIPALDKVGQGFEKGKIFLPQLLMSAEAAKAAFEEIRVKIAQSGVVEEKKGKIILATVKGDIHDIGKNIVKALLENYGYDIIDLGRDVPPETIAETVLRENVRLVGLSALMTTTVPAMEDAIKLLREAAPDCKVMVGGAVLTQEYADMIGADWYGKDAMAAVRCAEKMFNG